MGTNKKKKDIDDFEFKLRVKLEEELKSKNSIFRTYFETQIPIDKISNILKEEFKENIKVRKQCATLAFLVYRFENTFYEGQHCPEVEEWRDICTGEKSENEFADTMRSISFSPTEPKL